MWGCADTIFLRRCDPSGSLALRSAIKDLRFSWTINYGNKLRWYFLMADRKASDPLELLLERGQQLMVRKAEAGAILTHRGNQIAPQGLTANAG